MKKEEFDQLVKNLKSQEEGIALKAVEDVRKVGDETILPILAKLLASSQYEQVKTDIRKVFTDLKDQKSATAITEIIIDPDFANEKAFFVSTCWEGKVDYSGFLPLFVDLVIEDDFNVSMEALTVIEEMKGPFDENDLLEGIDRAHEYLDFPNNENEALVENLLKTLQNRLDNISPEERF